VFLHLTLLLTVELILPYISLKYAGQDSFKVKNKRRETESHRSEHKLIFSQLLNVKPFHNALYLGPLHHCYSFIVSFPYTSCMSSSFLNLTTLITLGKLYKLHVSPLCLISCSHLTSSLLFFC